jgi:hypothetical protein
LATGKEQAIKITPNSGLSQAEITQYAQEQSAAKGQPAEPGLASGGRGGEYNRAKPDGPDNVGEVKKSDKKKGLFGLFGS